jgi:hypothetical protein
VLLGSAILLPLVVLVRGAIVSDDLMVFLNFTRPEVSLLLWLLAGSSLIHLLMVWGEVSLTHSTAHAHLAIWEMVKGRYRNEFWIGIILSLLGGLLPVLTALGVLSISLGVAGAPLALIGLMLFEGAYVQAAQSVPLA